MAAEYVNSRSSRKRRWAAPLSILLIFILVLVVGVLAIVNYDAPLSQEAEAWFGSERTQTVKPEENMYYLAVGFGVPGSMDPVVEGKRWTDEYNKALVEWMAGDDIYIVQAPELEESSIFSTIKNSLLDFDVENRSEKLLAQSDEFFDLYEECGFLHRRYKRFSGYTQLETPLTPAAGVDFPTFTKLIRYDRLVHDYLLLSYKIGRDSEALGLLDSGIRHSRVVLREADYMLLKLVGNVRVGRKLQLVDLMLDEGDRPSYELYEFVKAIPPLTAEERSLRKALKYEGWISFNTNQATQNMSLEGGEPIAYFKQVLRRLTLKPNRTANLRVESYSNISDRTELPGKEYYKRRNDPFVEIPFIERVVNLVGSMQAELGPAYMEYADAGFDLDGKIMLLKAKADILYNGISMNDVPGFLEKNKDKYYNVFTGDKLTWKPETGQIMYEGYNQENNIIQRTVTISFE